MERRRRRRLATAAAAALAAAAFACVAVLPARSLADSKVIVAVNTPTTLGGLEAAARGQRIAMGRLEAQMKVVRGQYDAAVATLTEVNQRLSQTRLELSQSQEALDRQNALVGARLAAMYKMGSFSILDVLAGSASFTQAQTQVQFFRLLALQDQRDDRELASLNTQVTGLAATLADQRAAAQNAQNAVDQQRLVMTDKIAQRKAILEQLTRQIQRILDRQHPHNGLVSPVALSGHYTQLTWAKALLEQLHMPLTTQNTAAITAWEMAEGGHWHNSAHYNPLNTTMPEPGATSMNSVGVKAYTSWAQGFTATLATLHNGYYGGILAALRAGDNAIAVADAVAASPWGTGNFSGLL